MVTTITPAVSTTAEIPYVTADEAYTLLQTAFERLLKLLADLDPSDWGKPTACTEWNVHDMVAHQAGGYASGASYGEMLRQYSVMPKPGQLPEDAVNARQVGERAAKTPAALIAELERVGPPAMRNWAYGFRAVKWIAIPHAIPGVLSLRHLMWVIHSRDTWMHRLDICRATGRAFEQTAEHDGRIVALVMRDVGQALRRKLGGRALAFELGGTAGGSWQFGAGQPAALVQMDALEFNIFVSGRSRLPQARPLMQISGDVAWAESLLKGVLILY
jgi:uncharacterized protein (TIGR03083 family)